MGVTWVHSSTGVKIPIAAIAEAVTRANRGRASADRCLLIVDGVHGFANQDVDVARLGCDFFAAGTHKWLFAPRGTGFLWGRRDVWPELRPTIPSFDPDERQTWDAWMDRKALPPTEASFISPGGFLAFEHLLAIPAAVELHRTIGRDRIAARIRELNTAFREGAAKMAGVTLHTPRDPELSGGLSCFEVAGVKPEEVANRLADKEDPHEQLAVQGLLRARGRRHHELSGRDRDGAPRDPGACDEVCSGVERLLQASETS